MFLYKDYEGCGKSARVVNDRPLGRKGFAWSDNRTSSLMRGQPGEFRNDRYIKKSLAEWRNGTLLELNNGLWMNVNFIITRPHICRDVLRMWINEKEFIVPVKLFDEYHRGNCRDLKLYLRSSYWTRKTYRQSFAFYYRSIWGSLYFLTVQKPPSHVSFKYYAEGFILLHFYHKHRWLQPCLYRVLHTPRHVIQCT